ncbi:MAG: hypothetical protein AB8B82_10430 [Roseovarius sp.]
MTLHLLHTADVHCQTFDALRDQIAPDQVLNHHVHTDWLERAQSGIDDALRDEITGYIAHSGGPVLCTCTTLGPVVQAAGGIRIDQPMMQAAVLTTGTIVMAYCLNSTLGPSLDLLEAALQEAGTPRKVHPLPLNALWPLFEAGERAAFDIGISAQIRQLAPTLPDLGCVVLAQASMAGAADLLRDMPFAVLASPELALRAALQHNAS